MKENNEHEFYDWARNIKDEVKHISEIESGKKGYYCIDCKREMIAKKGDILRHHFSHVANDKILPGKCTFSNETHRHKIAKEILQRIQKIKVPALYKYPPIGVTGRAFKIKDSQLVAASKVEIELSFYEDEIGEIKWGKNVNFEKESQKELLIRPDVTFFDKNDKPFLLIELVATHKIDKNKLFNIRSLGIDTIQVLIPRDTTTEIENTFFRTRQTEWIYNNEQEQTEYIRISEGDYQGILSINEFQKRILESVESYQCRAAQINNFIRAIRKHLDSEQFRDAKRNIGEEIQRVETNTRRNQNEWGAIQARIRGGVDRQFDSEKTSIEFEEAELQGDFGTKGDEIETRRRNLERRYIKKREELHGATTSLTVEEIEYQPECQREIEKVERNLSQLGFGKRSFEERIEDIGSERIRIEQEFEDNKGVVELEITETEQQTNEIESRIRNLSEEFRRKEAGIREGFEKRRGELIARIENLRNESINAVENRDGKLSSRIQREITEIVDRGKDLGDIASQAASVARLRRAKELFDQRAWKDWI